MGLFATEDGHFKGWLAAFLCCCAAVMDDESPYEKEQSIPSTRAGGCNEQPLSLTNLPTVPTELSFTSTNDKDLAEPARNKTPRSSSVSDRPPSIKPLDLGDDALFNRWPYHGEQKSSTGGHSTRPSISTPYNFRRLDHFDTQRQNLVPLRLGPVVLRDPPFPDDDQLETAHARSRSESTQHLLSDATEGESYLQNRETPFQRCRQTNSRVWPVVPEPVHIEDATPPMHERCPVRPTMARRSRSSGSLRQSITERSLMSIPLRPSTERLRPKRKHSLQSLRKSFADDDENVEREIVELNTIVEERRAEAARSGPPEHHIAALAPSMQIRARSETLDATGSALSRPATAHDRHVLAGSVDNSPEWFIARSTTSNNRTSNRVSGWLSGLLPSTTTHFPTNEPFYKCQPPPRPTRAWSDSSMTTSLTETDSPSLTAPSSPTSKGHSRSHTDESHLTPITPAGMSAGHEDSEGQKFVYDRWPVTMRPTSQVGVAI